MVNQMFLYGNEIGEKLRDILKHYFKQSKDLTLVPSCPCAIRLSLVLCQPSIMIHPVTYKSRPVRQCQARQ